MRLNRAEILSKSKHNLHIEFAEQHLTSYGGLELIRRYFNLICLYKLVRSAFAEYELGGDYRPVDMILVIIVLLLTGGSRLEHIAHLSSDPLVKRFCGLLRLPSDRSISNWLKRFSMKSMQALIEINSQIVSEAIDRENLGRLTIDVDGSVISTGSNVAWSFRGFNPHHRKNQSYYPILAHVSQTGHILRVKNRPGNVHDSRGAGCFIRELIDDIRIRLTKRIPLEFRMDGAFFQKSVIDILERRKVSYAIKVPFYKWLDLIGLIRARKRWNRMKDGMGYFEAEIYIKKWKRSVSVVIYRKKVYHKSRKNYQLDLFDPNDGYYEYSAVTSSMELSASALWDFMSGRGAQEKTFAELKGEWSFDSVVTNHYAANSAWQQISVLGHNLLRSFQLHTIAEKKPRSSKRTYSWFIRSLKTLRFILINQPARIVRPQGYNVLRFSVAKPTEEIISDIEMKLAA